MVSHPHPQSQYHSLDNERFFTKINHVSDVRVSNLGVLPEMARWQTVCQVGQFCLRLALQRIIEGEVKSKERLEPKGAGDSQ